MKKQRNPQAKQKVTSPHSKPLKRKLEMLPQQMPKKARQQSIKSSRKSSANIATTTPVVNNKNSRGRKPKLTSVALDASAGSFVSELMSPPIPIENICDHIYKKYVLEQRRSGDEIEQSVYLCTLCGSKKNQ